MKGKGREGEVPGTDLRSAPVQQKFSFVKSQRGFAYRYCLRRTTALSKIDIVTADCFFVSSSPSCFLDSQFAPPIIHKYHKHPYGGAALTTYLRYPCTKHAVGIEYQGTWYQGNQLPVPGTPFSLVPRPGATWNMIPGGTGVQTGSASQDRYGTYRWHQVLS